MDVIHRKINRTNLWRCVKIIIKCLIKDIHHSLICFKILLLISATYFYLISGIVISIYERTSNSTIDKVNVEWNIAIAICAAIVAIIGLLFFYSIVRNILFPHKGKQRNSKYLISQIKTDDRRAPLASKEQLIERIAGKEESINIKDDIANEIDKIINPIEEFILNSEKTLILDGKWGAGKTSYTLIAIDNISRDQEFETTDYRFIYESAFKYVSGFNEFKLDILKALQIILSEQNIIVPYIIRELSNNIRPSNLHIPLSNISGSVTTTDYIDKLNKKYERKQRRNPKPFQIIVIIDDIDRLLGPEIIETVSFLSIIRRMKFVKIIIPIDRTVVIKQLKEAKVTDPETYIKKHLPEQTENIIPTTFNLFKQIYSQKIRKEFGSELSDEQIRPILEIICVKIFSNKLNENMRAVNIESLGDWQLGSEIPEELRQPNEYNSTYILNARNYIFNTVRSDVKQNMTFHTGASREFEAIIYKLKYKDKRTLLKDGTNPLRVDSELYNDCLSSWILPFSESRWSQVGATMRTIDDIYEEFKNNINKNYIETNMMPCKIFVRAYNKLLPEWQILDENLEK